MTALVLTSVTLRYEPSAPPVIHQADLLMTRGERVALLGVNGSGKTSLLMAIAGLLPHEGEISVGGTRLGPKTLEHVRESIGVLFNVPEDQLLFPHVLDDVAFSLLRRGSSREESLARAKEVLVQLGIGHLAHALLHTLSHGQKQRVALAGALVANPQLLLLDEPSSGLDLPAKRKLERLLDQQHSAMLLATHDLTFATRLCSRFVLLERGELVETDVREVQRRWETEEASMP